jgi:hypothetical protein
VVQWDRQGSRESSISTGNSIWMSMVFWSHDDVQVMCVCNSWGEDNASRSLHGRSLIYVTMSTSKLCVWWLWVMWLVLAVGFSASGAETLDVSVFCDACSLSTKSLFLGKKILGVAFIVVHGNSGPWVVSLLKALSEDPWIFSVMKTCDSMILLWFRLRDDKTCALETLLENLIRF